MRNFTSYWKKYGMYALLLLLIVVFTIIEPDKFFTSVTFYNILKQASVLGVLCCGVTILLIMGEIDISVGARCAFITIICGRMLLAGVPIWLVIVAGAALGAVTGAVNAILADLLHTNTFIITMATMNIWTGVCYLINGAQTLYGFPGSFKNVSQYMIFGKIPSIIIIFLVCAVIAGFILSKTYFGRYLYAIGGNKEAAYLAGLDVKHDTLYAHMLAGAFIGIGSIILMSRTMTALANTGSSYAFDCITACVLGGVMLIGGSGKMYQAMLGVLVINVLFNGLTLMGLSDYWQTVVKGLILILAIGLEVLQRKTKISVIEDKNINKTPQPPAKKTDAASVSG